MVDKEGASRGGLVWPPKFGPIPDASQVGQIGDLNSGEAGTVSVVNHPPHYNAGKIEVIEMIEDQKLGYHLGNAVKYVMRAGKKGGPAKEIEDLEKAAWYLKRRLALLYAEQAGHTPVRPNDMNKRGL